MELIKQELTAEREKYVPDLLGLFSAYLVLLSLEYFKSFFSKITPGYSHPSSTDLWAVGGDVSDVWSISPRGKLKISAVDLQGNHKVILL